MSEPILDRYPGVAGQPRAMALMCGALIELGHDDDGYRIASAALAAAPHDTVVRDIVQKTLSEQVSSFHLSMLQDEPRNAAYAAAITRAVKPGMRVLEIGTGAGLLALLAARAGAEVFTCESNPLIAAAARAVVARNGFGDRITVLAKRSTDLRIGIDLPDRCDLLVSEIFGDDLFEEGVVDAIGDARARLLSADAAILPPRAELRLALVTDDRSCPPLNDVLNFDLSPFAPLTHQRRRLPHGPSARVRLCSPPVSALSVDFDGPTIRALRERITLRSLGGRADGIAHWLRIDFGDGVRYENEPFVSPMAHWTIPLHAFSRPRHIRAGDAIEAEVRIFGGRLIVSAND